MADWPQSVPFNPLHISSVSLQGPLNASRGPSISTGAWPAANLALYLPFRLSAPFTVTKMWVIIGTAFSGSIDLGIYTAVGTRLVSMGIGTPTAINSIYTANLADTWLGPGQYFMALSNGIVTAFQRSAPATTIISALGCFQQASAHPLPTSATFAPISNTYYPCMGLTSKTTI